MYVRFEGFYNQKNENIFRKSYRVKKWYEGTPSYFLFAGLRPAIASEDVTGHFNEDGIGHSREDVTSHSNEDVIGRSD
jgi:hypothetical protein